MTSGNYLADPMGITVMDDGTVLVSDCEKGCIHMFDDGGKHLGKFGQDGASRVRHPAGEAETYCMCAHHLVFSNSTQTRVV